MRKTIFILFAILFFFVPLILWPFTSEVFEFNKMVFVYILTTLIVASWLTRTVLVKKFIFRRTALDIPILIFIGSQLLSTVLSIDPTTSWLGYYSRFNGGLLSTICYSLLYWAFVSNLDRKSALRTLYSVLISAAMVSVYGVLEHFGIDKNIWVQDVQNRVFSTLGQPNWLAAWLVALIPITWALMLNSKPYLKSKKFWIFFSLSALFFWTLIFTKSRSGILGFGIASIIFWGAVIWFEKREIKNFMSPILAIGISILMICLISGTQYTPSLAEMVRGPAQHQLSIESGAGPALETGGTESGIIREIVWKGAVQVWAHYPIFGSGVETFAYSYYLYRPAEHNLVSEWDFIYNKAHNEFLNVAANSGSVGLVSYLVLIGFSIFIFVQKPKINKSTNLQISNKSINSQIKNSELAESWQVEIDSLRFALFAGYISLSVTNFFGFSVVPTQLEFFLFPAIAIVIAAQSTEYKVQSRKLETIQKFFIVLVLCTMFYVLFAVGKYWFADTLYAKGKAFNSVQKPDSALIYLNRAISLEPAQALYHNELSGSYTTIALYYYQQKDTSKAKEFTNLATSESDKAIALSPANVNLKRSRFGVFVTLSQIDPNYLINARDTLIDAINYAPTDAKLYYNLGLIYARIGQGDLATKTLQKTIDLKSNYREARLAYAILLIDKKQNAEAKTQLEYILRNIDPNDSLTKQTLESLK